MKKCAIRREVRGQRAVDGAGVHLVRVLGRGDTKEFDPFLMLDSFDSLNPEDYLAGFPTHPHRGIETITFLISGEIAHADSLGNRDTIRAGEAQWMTAGSGILHQEMPRRSERMLGLQLWLNLPRDEKMAPPAYLSILPEQIGVERREGAEIRVISGRFGEAVGVVPQHIKASIYDISLAPGGAMDIPVDPAENAFVFLIEGDALVAGRQVGSKTAVLLGEGEAVTVAAPTETSARLIFCSGKPLGEPIAWGGPIVMNTDDELNHAFAELRQGTFIKHK